MGKILYSLWKRVTSMVYKSRFSVDFSGYYHGLGWIDICTRGSVIRTDFLSRWRYKLTFMNVCNPYVALDFSKFWVPARKLISTKNWKSFSRRPCTLRWNTFKYILCLFSLIEWEKKKNIFFGNFLKCELRVACIDNILLI